MFVTVIISAICATLFCIYAIKLHKYWERKGVKQRFVIPFLGDNFDVLFKNQAFFDLITNIYNSFPSTRYTGVYLFHKPVLMVKDPELIKNMCVRDFEHFLDHYAFLPDDFDPLWNKNLFSLKGQKWKDMRSTLSPSFTGSKMRQMFNLILESAENFTNFLAQDSGDLLEIEFKDAFTRYTNDTIASTAFGIKCDSLKERDNEFFVRGRETTTYKSIKLTLVVLMPWIGKFIDGSIFDKEVSKFFRKIIKETMDYRKKNNTERPDMINLLMNARNDVQKDNETDKVEENNFAAVDEHLEIKPQKPKMDLTLDDITSQALFFFVAGFDTVASSMCSMAYELAVNPDVQKKLIEELDEFRAAQALTYEGFNKLPYLDMVFTETLRKWPPSLVTDRTCVKPYTIEPKNPDEKPVDLEPSSIIGIPIWALHHDPKYWKNPDKFDPERFSLENKEKIVPYTYMPFGIGPRNCIGSRFAIMEVKVVFYKLLEHFEIVPIEKSIIPFVPKRKSFILSSENGFWFGLKRRNV